MDERLDLPLIPTRGPTFVFAALLGLPLIGLTAVITGLLVWPPDDPLLAPMVIGVFVVVCAIPNIVFRLLRRTRAWLDGDTLVLRTGLTLRRVPLADLRAGGLNVIDLRQHCELQFTTRFWGVNLPGLNSGWFRLHDGHVAVCLVTDRSRVCLMRRASDGTVYLLSLADPQPLRSRLAR